MGDRGGERGGFGRGFGEGGKGKGEGKGKGKGDGKGKGKGKGKGRGDGEKARRRPAGSAVDRPDCTASGVLHRTRRPDEAGVTPREPAPACPPSHETLLRSAPCALEACGERRLAAVALARAGLRG
jgi:hypothetical protein